MSRRPLVLLVCLAAAVPLHAAPLRANPVPTDVAERFRGLVRSTAAAGECPDRTLLIEEFGRFGLDLLSREELDLIHTRFDAFAPVLAAAQGPPHAPHFAIHDVILDEADPAQVQEEVLSLRRWLTEDVREAPWGGMMRLVDERSVRRRIADCRTAAAEMLSDWGDTASLPALMALAARDLGHERLAVVRRSIARVQNPCARTALYRDRGGSIVWCLRAEDVVSAHVEGGCRDRYGRGLMKRERDLSPVEVRQLVGLLRSSQPGRTNIFPQVVRVTLELASGFRLTLEPAKYPCVRLEDSATRRDVGWGRILESRELHRWLNALISCEEESP